MMLAGSSETCNEVIGSDILGGRTEPASPVVVAVTCSNGSQFFVDPAAAEPKRKTSLPAAGPLVLSEAQAFSSCEGKVREGLPLPGSYERHAGTSQFASAPGGGALVSFDFGALNGLGFPLAMHAECLLDGNRIARLEVQPR